jgi:hypothetical protein
VVPPHYRQTPLQYKPSGNLLATVRLQTPQRSLGIRAGNSNSYCKRLCSDAPITSDAREGDAPE